MMVEETTDEREEMLLAIEKQAALVAAQLTEALRVEGVLSEDERVAFVFEEVELV